MPLCPVCQTKLTQVEEAGISAAACAQCRGTWISASALNRRTRNESTPGVPHSALASMAALSNEAAHANTTTPLQCPTCRQTMVKERFHPQIAVQIDRCATCGYIWLDAGELGLLLRLHRELAARHGLTLPARRTEEVEKLRDWSSAPAPPEEHVGPTPLHMGAAVLNVLTDVLMWPSYGPV